MVTQTLELLFPHPQGPVAYCTCKDRTRNCPVAYRAWHARKYPGKYAYTSEHVLTVPANDVN